MATPSYVMPGRNFLQYQIEEGRTYYVDVAHMDIDVNSPLRYLLDTPADKFTYAWLRMSVSKGGVLTVYEEATASDTGAAITLFNANRNVADNANIKMYEYPTITDSGSMIGSQQFDVEGGVQVSGLQAPIILRKATRYYITFTPKQNNNIVNVLFAFVEYD